MQGQGWRVVQCQGPQHALHQVFVIIGRSTYHLATTGACLYPNNPMSQAFILPPCVAPGQNSFCP